MEKNLQAYQVLGLRALVRPFALRDTKQNLFFLRRGIQVTFFSLLVNYLDVVQFHTAAVGSCQRSSERDFFSKLAPLSTIRFCALNLKQRKLKKAPPYSNLHNKLLIKELSHNKRLFTQ